MRIFDADATRAALAFERLIPALAAAFVEPCEVPQRHRHVIAGEGGSTMDLLIMPAWQGTGDRGGGLLGIKTVTIAAGNRARGLPALHASYLLMDAATGRPLALLDGNEITARRTAAASALAASKLRGGREAARLLVVGAGRVASLLPQAYRAALPIAEVRVWARRPEAARELAAQLARQGFVAEAVADLAQACCEADIVSCATLAAEPLVEGRRLRADSHLDLIGGFTPAMREADDACFVGAAIYVDTPEALAKSGDLLGPIERGVIDAGAVRGTLADLCTGRAPMPDGAQRSVFKSVGTALEDLAAARLVIEAAPSAVGAAQASPAAPGP